MYRQMSLGFVLVLLWTLPLIAPAATPQAQLDQAISLYRRGEFDRSRPLLEQLLRARPAAPLEARVRLYLGFHEAAAQRMAQAEGQFAAALRLDPALKIKQTQLKTAVVEILERLRWQMRGWLLVSADLEGAVVFVDGQRVGPAPYRGAQRLGRHEVEVRPPPTRPHHAAHHQQVTLGPGATVRIEARLLALRGELPSAKRDASSNPWRKPGRWAWVVAGGALVGAATAGGLGVAALGSRDQADAFALAGSPARGADVKQHGELVADADRLATGTNIAWGVAGVLAAVSAALFVWQVW